MIRILIPISLFNHKRIELFRRVVPLKTILKEDIERAATKRSDMHYFYEGFLENENRLKQLVCRLTDDPCFVYNVQIQDMKTVVIEDTSVLGESYVR